LKHGGGLVSLKVGSRLRTPTSTAEVIVVKAPATDGELQCAGGAMSTEDVPGERQDGGGSPILLGKRYTDAESGIELLCTKPGAGPLSFDGRELGIKSAATLPASD
jgi:hypothetical protein